MPDNGDRKIYEQIHAETIPGSSWQQGGRGRESGCLMVGIDRFMTKYKKNPYPAAAAGSRAAGGGNKDA